MANTATTCPLCNDSGKICIDCGRPFPCPDGHDLGVECPCVKDKALAAKKDAAPWRKKRKGPATFSATQIETADSCLRKWWLKKVRQLPEASTGSQTFGTVLHAVNDRWLSADELGRDKNGNPVDLYPPGWTKAVDRYDSTKCDGEITPAEADTIQRLVAAAIENGTLVRLPGRQIEAAFNTELVAGGECPKCNGIGQTKFDTGMEPATVTDRPRDIVDADCPDCHGTGRLSAARVVGFIDMAEPNGIQDHKSCKLAKYAKSPDKLKKDIQMMLYAKILLLGLTEAGMPIPEKVSLRHNQFIKDPDDLRVKKTEAFVTVEQIETKWAEIQLTAKKMLHYREKAETWSDLPRPTTPNTCNAYGGCPFLSICGGRESEAEYADRMSPTAITTPLTVKGSEIVSVENNPEKKIENPLDTQSTSSILEASAVDATQNIPTERKHPMPPTGLLASILGTKPVTTAPAQPTAGINPPVTTPSPAPTPAITTAPAAATPSAAGAPPWYNPGCKACVDSPGFNSNGNPCRICDIKMSEEEKSAGYEVTDLKDGTARWTRRDDPSLTGVSKLRANAGVPVTVTEKVESPAAKKVKTPVAEPSPKVVAIVVETPAPAPAPVAEVEDALVSNFSPPATVELPDTGDGRETNMGQAGGRGRPKKGWILLINCCRWKFTTTKTHLATDLFYQVQKQIEAEAKCNYYDIDAFKRRDAIARSAEAIAATIPAGYVQVDLVNATPDMKSFIEAIRVYAYEEIVGV